MSEQQPDRISDNLGDVVGAGPTAPNSPDATPAETAQDSVQDPAKQSINVESPKIAPEQGEGDKAKEPKVEVTKSEAAKAETPRVEAKAEAPKSPGQILIMPREQAWNGDSGEPKTQSAAGGIFGRRRVAALAAVIALAAVAGAIGGALATAGFGRVAGDSPKVASSRALEDTISRLDTEVAALRTSLEQASKHSAAQISKTGDRLDKVEKAQAEPAAKLAKLSETVEKLRTAVSRRTGGCAGRGCRSSPGRAEGVHGIDSNRQCRAGTGSATRAEAGSRQAADGRRLGIARRRQRQRPDRRPAGHLRGIRRRSDPGPRPHRRHPQAGWPLGGGHQPGPDRRALTSAAIQHVIPGRSQRDANPESGR